MLLLRAYSVIHQEDSWLCSWRKKFCWQMKPYFRALLRKFGLCEWVDRSGVMRKMAYTFLSRVSRITVEFICAAKIAIWKIASHAILLTKLCMHGRPRRQGISQTQMFMLLNRFLWSNKTSLPYLDRKAINGELTGGCAWFLCSRAPCCAHAHV